MTEVYLGDFLYKFPCDDLSELADHTLLYLEERWVIKRLILPVTTPYQDGMICGLK